MRFSPFSAVSAVAILAIFGHSTAARLPKRQTGPVSPDTDPDCWGWDTVYTSADDCAYFEGWWGISHADFVAWNPSVKNDCSGIVVGHSYCVAVQRKPTSTSSSAVPTSSGPPKPSPTLDGLISTCNAFHKVEKGQTCDKIVSTYGTFTRSQFQEWNPATGTDCDLWAGYYYCIGIPGTPTTRPTSTGGTPTGSPKPSPTLDGLIDTCQKFYLVEKGDTCDKIIKKFGNTFTQKQFQTWNPATGDNCDLWAAYYYCVGIPGTPTQSAPITTTSTKTNGITTPTPIQEGMVGNCDEFYFVKSGDTCAKIAAAYGITVAQFTTWNTQVGGSACTGLFANVNVCVSIIGFTAVKPTSTSTSSCKTAYPTPTQPGSVCKCAQWYLPADGEYCDALQKKFKLTKAQFLALNPNVGDNCEGLWKGYNVCVKAG